MSTHKYSGITVYTPVMRTVSGWCVVKGSFVVRCVVRGMNMCTLDVFRNIHVGMHQYSRQSRGGVKYKIRVFEGV